MIGNKGFVTIDFMFAIVIGFSMVILVFAMTLTLSVVEVAQYVVYSAARAQSAGNISPEAQMKAARDKYKSLIGHEFLEGLFNGPFFEISDSNKLEVKPGVLEGRSLSGSSFYSEKEYSSKDPNRPVFQGVRANFTAKILQLKIPFLGTISNDEEGFKSRILSIMLREPSMEECFDFMKLRMEKIWRLNKGRSYEFKSNARKDVAVAWEDNGC